MYVPEHFKVSDRQEMLSFLEANAFGQLISVADNRPTASHLPFLVADDLKYLQCHLARQNPQWKQLEAQQVLVTFQGAHDYISPSWYQTHRRANLELPGPAYLRSLPGFRRSRGTRRVVEALSKRYESNFEAPWEAQYRDAMLKAIVGVEIEIEEIQCKYKLSQNRPAADHQGVIDNLDQTGLGRRWSRQCAKPFHELD